MPALTVFARIAIVAGCVFIGLHAYLMGRTPSPAGDVAIAVSGLATIAGYALIRSRRTFITRTLVLVAFVWTGLAFIAGLLFLIADLAADLLALAAPGPGAVVIWAGAAIIGLFGFLRARNPVVLTRRIEGLFDAPVRVLQLTDVHIGDVWSARHLDRVVDRAVAESPDIVVITGDLLDGMEPVDARAIAALGRFEVPVFFVSGNHDSYTRRDELLVCLRRIGVVPLEGCIHIADRVSILGIAYGMDDEATSDLLIRFRTAPRPRIILKHKPAELDPLIDAAPDAVLCGHVHGGQIWPFGHLARLEFAHADGTKQVGRTLVHVSQGTATWGPPFRLGTRSEITVFDFAPI